MSYSIVDVEIFALGSVFRLSVLLSKDVRTTVGYVPTGTNDSVTHSGEHFI